VFDSERADQEGKKPTFVDAFAGCGGLSLGLMRAGWTGLFAIEKDVHAFETLSKNLLDVERSVRFQWPDWLPKGPHCATELTSVYRKKLTALAGEVDMLVGGPPCQGYSSAGRRDPEDPRNRLFSSYLDLVNLIRPKIVLLENVRGITTDFISSEKPGARVNYASKLIEALSADFDVSTKMLNLSTFGIPQSRSRFFLIGVRKGERSNGLPEDPFELIESKRLEFIRSKGITAATSAKAAISDLEIARNGTVPSLDSAGFQSIGYNGPITPYQLLMRDEAEGPLSDTRLAKHRPDISARFKEIIADCHAEGRLNVSLRREVREAYGLRKQAIRVLDPARPAPTITSMPDDLLHYSEPRALTVRENARLQSFPDWFRFYGKYTTGGHRRRFEVPRFTQVANAVPPLAAEALGRSIIEYVRVPINGEFPLIESQPNEGSQILERVAVTY